MSGWRQARTAQQKFPRRATCVAVRISTIDPEIDPDSGEAFFRSTEATTANLSRGGAFVHSWEPLAAGRRVIVALDLPSGGELTLVGRVVWTRRRLESSQPGVLENPGYGIEFTGSRAEQAALQQILDADPSGPTPGAVLAAGAPSSAGSSATVPPPTASAPSVPTPPTSSTTSPTAPTSPARGHFATAR